MPSRSLLLVTPERSDAATLTGSATSGTMTISNLQTIQPTDVTRWASIADCRATFDLGAAYPIDSIWLGYHNGSSAGTLRVRAATTEAGLTSSPPFDQTIDLWPAGADLATWPRRHTLLHLAAAETYRWWRLDPADPTNPAGYFEAGRAILALAFKPALGLQYGASFGTLEEPRRRRTQGGQVHPIPQPRQALAECAIKCKTLDEAYLKAHQIGRLRGVSDDVLLIYSPEEPAYLQQRTAYGLLSAPTVVTIESYAYHATSFRVEELP